MQKHLIYYIFSLIICNYSYSAETSASLTQDITKIKNACSDILTIRLSAPNAPLSPDNLTKHYQLVMFGSVGLTAIERKLSSYSEKEQTELRSQLKEASDIINQLRWSLPKP